MLDVTITFGIVVEVFRRRGPQHKNRTYSSRSTTYVSVFSVRCPSPKDLNINTERYSYLSPTAGSGLRSGVSVFVHYLVGGLPATGTSK